MGKAARDNKAKGVVIVKKIPTIFFILIMPIFLSSCASRYASEKDLSYLTLHMKKEAATDRMASQGVIRGALVNKYGQTIEVVEYVMKDLRFGALSPECIKTYWLYFCDGELVQWGRAGDWAEAQRQIYDINFNMTSQKA